MDPDRASITPASPVATPRFRHVVVADPSPVAAADWLLAHGADVVIVAEDVAPFAMLVNAYGDDVQTVELPAHVIRDRTALRASVEATGIEPDAIVVVPTRPGDHRYAIAQPSVVAA
ncbi:hypothetical protein [Agrococcus jejuensis]|uniref:Uncharacterized protein n=1 Tax=Agrococcus jejuensis TaxID=399736 RepID=A0A1G8FA32_9MICO|nr:hypothetical protein [Agrococcus jejuensis]SDH78945.1 hypothetical protein SAMN04489720_2395 [Agrococcus jejuensis]